LPTEREILDGFEGPGFGSPARRGARHTSAAARAQFQPHRRVDGEGGVVYLGCHEFTTYKRVTAAKSLARTKGIKVDGKVVFLRLKLKGEEESEG
jgi:hypothetical protein